jgi:hypothetical protein
MSDFNSLLPPSPEMRDINRDRTACLKPSALPAATHAGPGSINCDSSNPFPFSLLLSPAAKRFHLLVLLLSPFSLLPSPAATPPGGDAAAPAVNWVLPIFTDKEGYRSMTLRGSEVRPDGRRIVVTDLSITIFSGDAASQVDSMLLSQSAVFSPKENMASGDKSVRFIRDDIEVTGVGWTYDHATKKVTLKENVRVTFRAQLNDILK